MYCPRCATQNMDSARFCRSCGANLSLVPQALSGRLPEDRPDQVERAIKRAIKRRREPDLGRGIRKIAIGFAFLVIVVALFLTRGSPGLGVIWLLIPAFLLLGKGIGEIINAHGAQHPTRQVEAPPPSLRTHELSSLETHDNAPAPA